MMAHATLPACLLCFHHFTCKCIRHPSSLNDHLSAYPLGQVELHLRLRVPRVGHYVVVVEYVTEGDQLVVVDVSMESPGAVVEGQVNIYSCKFR